MIKEITVFANGDSSKISTWSNVPYFFTETMMAKGIKVNRVDLSPDRDKEARFNKVARRIIKLLTKRNHCYDYFRSKVHFNNVRARIKKAIADYPDADALLFLTFSFSAGGLTDKKKVLFGDWTFDYHINYFCQRKPDFFERKSIGREDAQINASDLILPLFPKVADYMKLRYGGKDIRYLGNVINALVDFTESETDTILQEKVDTHKLLFIGGTKYAEGAEQLIAAYGILKKQNPALSLHIIGMTEANFGELPPDTHCYGYLDKEDEQQREQYYRLMREAQLFINTTSKWGAFSASIEAMYFHIPVVVRPYDEFKQTFEDGAEGIVYYTGSSPEELAKTISDTTGSDSYKQKCMSAHSLVESFTWSAYADKVLEGIAGIEK